MWYENLLIFCMFQTIQNSLEGYNFFLQKINYLDGWGVTPPRPAQSAVAGSEATRHISIWQAHLTSSSHILLARSYQKVGQTSVQHVHCTECLVWVWRQAIGRCIWEMRVGVYFLFQKQTVQHCFVPQQSQTSFSTSLIFFLRVFRSIFARHILCLRSCAQAHLQNVGLGLRDP